MYTRFIRWATERIHDDGVIAFVSNNSFIEGQAFDGFRKIIAQEFNEIYILNMKGNAHASGEERKRQAGNVFNDQIRVGVAIYFLVKRKGEKRCKIFYNEVSDYATARDKQIYLDENKFAYIEFVQVVPDKKYTWINKTDNDFDVLIPVASKEAKAGINSKVIFQLFSGGLKSQRDEWVYDFSRNNLEAKIHFLVDIYQKTVANGDFPEKMLIKWDRELSKYADRRIKKEFSPYQITDSLYRPFVKMHSYYDKHFNGVTYQWGSIYSPQKRNLTIAFNVGSAEFVTIVSNAIVCQGTLLVGGGTTQCLPLYRNADNGEQVENITDWALGQFQKQYKDKQIGKQDIFSYVYAVLHHPAYRANYEANLKREFPRIPFYKDFGKWAGWGKRLMDLHLNYETIKPYNLEREDKPKDGIAPRLMARRESGVIEIDTATTLHGIPAEAWEYRLGTYSALEWILERYKEKKPKDPTIAERFNAYKFADYKEQVIDLLCRVCTVSVETMRIVKEMP